MLCCVGQVEEWVCGGVEMLLWFQDLLLWSVILG